VRYDGGSNTTQTFSNGRALVDVPRGVDATVNVTDETYVINRPLTAESVDGETTVEVIMYPKATAVVEVEDDSGVVRDAQVTLRKDGANEPLSPGVTGPNGVYQRSNVEAGTYTATVVKRGYRRTQAEVQVTPPSSGVTVSLEEATVPLTIQVFDDHFRTEQPLADAEVTVLAGGEQVRQGPTGDNGRVQFSAGVNGLYVIRVTKAGYTTAEREIPLGESGADYEFRIQRTPTLSVNTGADSVIAGESVLVQVRNAYNEPVESVLVRRNGTNVGTTDGNGELRVSIPEVGRYEIVATDDGVSSEPAVVQGFQPATPTTEATPTATATATATPEPTTTESAPLPGFGPLVGLLAVVLAVVLVRRRR
jgi:PGF-CTERM protein